MTQMSGNDESPSRDFGESLQFTNWVLDSVATCHMKPQVSDFIPVSLEDTDEYTEDADRHHVMAKQKGQVKIKMCDDNENTFIATFHNVLLVPDLCGRLFFIIALMNLGHTLFFKYIFK